MKEKEIEAIPTVKEMQGQRQQGFSRNAKAEANESQLYSRKRCLRRVGCAPGGEGGGRNNEHDSRHN